MYYVNLFSQTVILSTALIPLSTGLILFLCAIISFGLGTSTSRMLSPSFSLFWQFVKGFCLKLILQVISWKVRKELTVEWDDSICFTNSVQLLMSYNRIKWDDSILLFSVSQRVLLVSKLQKIYLQYLIEALIPYNWTDSSCSNHLTTNSTNKSAQSKFKKSMHFITGKIAVNLEMFKGQ